MRVGIFFLSVFLAGGQVQDEPKDERALIKAGSDALAKNQLHEAAEAFQKAVDLDPSSFEAHEGLGIALAREIIAGNVRPSEDSDATDRAENHLRQAAELEPSAGKPLITLAHMETALAEQTVDRNEQSLRYGKAQEALKRAIAVEPGRADLYLQLAIVERDQFGPAVQKARSQSSRAGGPIPDEDWRHQLQTKYGSLIEDAISNAHSAANLEGHSTKAFLLMARLLRERAQIRNSQQDYAADMQNADDWQRQFLAAGGHMDEMNSTAK